jgi:hypothetical protein
VWNTLRDLVRRKKLEPVTGITILFLQKRPESFTDEQLSLAMERAWGRKHDVTNFYGVSTFDGEGGLLKMDAMFFPMQHFQRRVDAALLGAQQLPSWAEHSAYSSFGYACPGGLPPSKIRDQMGWMLARFCAELLGENTSALLFTEASVLVPFNKKFDQKLRSSIGKNPEHLFVDPTEL